MTPRKEIFIKIKEALQTIPQLELVDLDRGQMSAEKEPHLFVAALITMTEQNQEGRASVDVTLYCRDGWLNQYQNTEDTEHGLNEIDLLDAIAEKLQFLQGEQFKPLEQIGDEIDSQTMKGNFAYRLSFDTMIYRKLAPKYKTVKMSLKQI